MPYLTQLSLQQPLGYHSGVKHHHRQFQTSLGFRLFSIVNSSFLTI